MLQDSFLQELQEKDDMQLKVSSQIQMKPKINDDLDDDAFLEEDFKKWVPNEAQKSSDLFIGKKVKSSEVFEYEEKKSENDDLFDFGDGSKKEDGEEEKSFGAEKEEGPDKVFEEMTDE